MLLRVFPYRLYRGDPGPFCLTMGSRRRNHGLGSVTCRELIPYCHSYYSFLSRYLPEYRQHAVDREESAENPTSLPSSPISSQRSPGGVDDGIDLHLLHLDPANWKKQDHYLILGLQDKRYQATAAEIKAAYRARVLQYHPDKLQQQKQQGQDQSKTPTPLHLEEDAIFKCIFHAYQVLSDPIKRKEYDSVDAQAFDESIPAEDAVAPRDTDGFLRLYRHVFKMNARFSKRQPVPDIGHAASPREDVEAFYAFWSTFESWRTFEYLDEEETAENRADKRWLERKNKAERLKRKNEDNARLRKLFEQAYRLDPRMVRFREDDRLRREAARMEREMAQMRLTEERERQKREEEERARCAAEIAINQEAERRRQKEATEARVRRERKALNKFFVDALYFVSDPTNVALINERSLLVGKFLLKADPTRLGELLTHLQSIPSGDQVMQWVESEYERARETEEAALAETPAKQNRSFTLADCMEQQAEEKWTLIETDTLIKAVKTHPGGLRDRWIRITEWYNRHISHLRDPSLRVRSTEDLLRRANSLRQTAEEGAISQAVPSDAQTDYKALQRRRDPRIDQATPTLIANADIGSSNLTADADVAGTSSTAAAAEWSAQEQRLLEQGLKSYKADDPARWDHISQMVGRSKKDCMSRAKEIARLLKLRKEASRA